MKPEIIVIGTSLGGLKALETVLTGLGEGFPVPIAIVQHRSNSGRDMLAALLQQHTTLIVNEAEDKESLKPAHVYVAPADYHLLIERGSCSLSLESPVCYARPSVDVLFESAAEAYGSGVIGIILTGSNADGAHGATSIKKSAGIIIVQDPDQCENGTMPLAAMAAVQVDYVMKLTEIAPWLTNRCRSWEDGKHASR